MLLPRSDALVKDTVVVCATAGQGLSVYRGRLHTNEASGAIRMRGGEYLERGKGGEKYDKDKWRRETKTAGVSFFLPPAPIILHSRRLANRL